MLKQAMVEEVKRLLASGEHSQRQVARITGVSRATVGLIALGRRPERLPRDEDEDTWEPSGPPSRCPGCGGLVYLPCQLCKVRALKARDEDRARFRRQVLVLAQEAQAREARRLSAPARHDAEPRREAPAPLRRAA